MSFVEIVNRVAKHFLKKYRNRLFYKQTGYKANIIGKITLINKNITCGENVSIYPDVMIFGDGLIQCGNNVSIGKDTILYSSKDGGLSIGDNTMIAGQCYIIDTNHGIEKGQLIRQQQNISSKIQIGNDVWIAANVTILKGVTIGDGAVVGAKALVNKDVPPNAVVAGIPARIINYRK